MKMGAKMDAESCHCRKNDHENERNEGRKMVAIIPAALRKRRDNARRVIHREREREREGKLEKTIDFRSTTDSRVRVATSKLL